MNTVTIGIWQAALFARKLLERSDITESQRNFANKMLWYGGTATCDLVHPVPSITMSVEHFELLLPPEESAPMTKT